MLLGGEADKAVKGSARGALEDEDVAVATQGQGGEHEELTNAGHQVEAHTREVLGRLEPVHIRQREGALRCVEGRAFRIPFEEACDLSLACRHDDEVALQRVALEVVNPGPA